MPDDVYVEAQDLIEADNPAVAAEEKRVAALKAKLKEVEKRVAAEAEELEAAALKAKLKAAEELEAAEAELKAAEERVAAALKAKLKEVEKRVAADNATFKKECTMLKANIETLVMQREEEEAKRKTLEAQLIEIERLAERYQSEGDEATKQKEA